MNADLHSLIRQLRAELAWARTTGVAPPEPLEEQAPSSQANSSAPSGLGEPAAGPVEPPSGLGEPATGPVEPPSGPKEPSTDPGGGPEVPTSVEAPLRSARSLPQVREVLGDCTRCKLHQRRTQIVFGVGRPDAEVMFIGEGPGADEDRKGEPFVGKAGQLLTRIIEQGMGIPRAQVYIANIVKCRPPGNRDPEAEEVAACLPFLEAQIRSVQPRVLVLLGRVAAQTLLETQAPMSRLRGKWTKVYDVPAMPTFHPAYLLRNPDGKRPVWEDIQEVLRFLGRPIPSPRAQPKEHP